ncbi:hypothetical protein I7I53_03322 [Histoplasma capsulatum var. duboisii H88]|uniref:Uncharacterized protein n=1 Tax=Ajellomyces capsulatus (strain H88) TaxID=544711 RepID=A0A8A1LMA3_AJEC8|nr:hypothetical protein I7I53_03322 [Histoplasma capsulatum var. duboisii H88]
MENGGWSSFKTSHGPKPTAHLARWIWFIRQEKYPNTLGIRPFPRRSRDDGRAARARSNKKAASAQGPV